MTDLEGITLPPEALGRISAVLAAPDQKIAALVVVAGLDPGVDFRHRDLRGWPLAGEDVRGFDFTGSDLRSTGIEDALQDDTTVLVEAVLDRRAKGRANGVAQARTAPPESGYTKVRIPDVSDAELLERSFVVDDPGALENLTPTAPPTNQWLTYEGRYDVGGRVTCAFGHRHKRGYVFRDEGDRRYLVGHECGAKHLGLGRWQSFTAGRERLEERASYLRLIRDLAQAFGERREWIAGLQRDPSVLATDRLRGELRLRCPGAVSAARTAFGRSEGRLFVKATVRNHAAEERRREREQEAKEWYAGLDAERRKEFHDRGGRAPSVDRSPLHKTETRPLGTLQGRSLFGSAHGLASGIGHLLGLVDRFLAMPYTPRNRRDLMEVARNASPDGGGVQRRADETPQAAGGRAASAGEVGCGGYPATRCHNCRPCPEAEAGQTHTKIANSPMRLYHFTTSANALSIKLTGIRPQEIAVSENKNLKRKAVSLTSNSNPSSLIGKSLTDGSPLSGKNLAVYLKANPSANPKGVYPTTKTCEARVEIDLPDNDPNLVWFTLKRVRSLGFNEKSFRSFVSLGGGKSGEWWIYTGHIPASFVVEARETYPSYATVL